MFHPALTKDGRTKNKWSAFIPPYLIEPFNIVPELNMLGLFFAFHYLMKCCKVTNQDGFGRLHIMPDALETSPIFVRFLG